MISTFDRIIFIHIQKTAGTSLVEALRKHYKSGVSLDHGEFVKVEKKDLPNYKLITGHFGFDYQDELVGNIYRFTFLRNPVDRIISLYHFCRERDPDQYEIYKIASESSLLEFTRSENPLVKAHIENTQTWQLARTWFPHTREQFGHLSGQDLLDEAKQNLRGLSYVGLTETYRADSRKIFQELGLPEIGDARANVTKNRPALTDLDDDVRDAIREKVLLDEELHEFVRTQLRAKAPAPAEETFSVESDSIQAQNSIRAIAFYLPQFHRVPENDEWWGPGFTEWTNVKRAKPLYKGHDQPRAPRELGYYDLSEPEVMRRQIELAREHGLTGFCFYHYRFGNGRQILEMPVVNLLQSPELDFPFCLCWANESWTRTWDGGEKHILIEQTYSKEDAVTFAEELVQFFKDPRYIRVAGKPLVVIYRSTHLPDVKEYVNMWREVWRENGIDEVYVCAALTGLNENVRDLGFDGGVEFPPHRGLFPIPPEITLEGICEGGFKGQAYDYRDWVSLHIFSPDPAFTVFRTVMMGWDNTARRGNRSKLFANCTPAIYEAWLGKTIQHTLEKNAPEEQIVFINAWNEWAEGTYLEPDESNGLAYLKATKAAIEGKSRGSEILDELSNGEAPSDELRREAHAYLTSLNNFIKRTGWSSENNPYEMLGRINEKLKAKQQAYHEMRSKRDALKEEAKKQRESVVGKFTRPLVNLERALRRLGKKP